MRILRSPSDAEEVLQETFVRVWSRAETYNARIWGSPAAWLTRIARNGAIDRLRAKHVRGDISVEQGAGVDEDAARLRLSQRPVRRRKWCCNGNATAGALGVALSSPCRPRSASSSKRRFSKGYTHTELAARFGVPLGR